MWCGGSYLHEECLEKSMLEKSSTDTNMPQLQVGGWRGTSSPQLLRLQACQGNNAKEKLAESTQDYNGKGVLLQLHHPRTILRGGAMYQHTATAAASATLHPATLGEMSAPHPKRHNQQQTPSQSVQAPNKNSSSVSDIFKVVAMIFQHITTELNEAESEEDRIMSITKIVLKLMKQNGC
jgi:hypothetical protein